MCKLKQIKNSAWVYYIYLYISFRSNMKRNVKIKITTRKKYLNIYT